MEWLSLLLAAVLFAAACNLDTVILSMGYAVKGVRVSLSPVSYTHLTLPTICSV